MPHPKVWLVFLNDFWGDWRQAEAAGRDIVEGGYLSGLTDYGSGIGTFLGVVQLRIANLPSVIKDSEIRDHIIGTSILLGELPPPDDETLYVLCTPGDVRVVFDGDSQGSCQTWCGYHSSGWTSDNRRFIYSVQPSSLCGPCGGDFASWTMVLSHEIAEAATDPFATGWYDDSDGSENADIVAWIPFQYGPWRVQGYHTNEHGNTIGQYLPPEQRPGWKPPAPEPPPEPPPIPDVKSYRDGVVDASVVLGQLQAATKRSNTVRLKALNDAMHAVERLLT